MIIKFVLVQMHNVHKFSIDDQSMCGPWCKVDNTGYKPKNLPYGKPLTCESFRVDLMKRFEKYAGKVSELVFMGSTQLSENLNHMISSRALKRF